MTGAGLRSSQLGSVLDAWVKDGRIVGGVVLLAEGDKVTGTAVSGWSDRGRRLPMRRHTVLRYASLTKLIVSASALVLCEQGKLDCHKPVAAWLPRFRPQTPDGTRPDILLCHLLTHTSGLSYGFEQAPGNAYEETGVSDGLDATGVSLEANLDRLAGLPLMFPPGTAWQYSLATDVLGAVIERASGQTLPQAISRLVTGPLGLDSMGFPPEARHTPAPAYWNRDGRVDRITGTGWYTVENGRCRVSETRPPASERYPSGGAGLVGTADDFMRLLLCLRGGGAPILEFESVHAMLSGAIGDVPISNRGPGWTFGLGPMILSDPKAAGISQGQGTWGWCGLHGGHYWVDPEHDLALVALTNTGVTGAWGEFADQLREVIYA